MKKLFFIIFYLFTLTYADNFNTNLDIKSPLETFNVSANLTSPNQINLNFKISQGYYIYKNRVNVYLLEEDKKIPLKINLPNGLKLKLYETNPNGKLVQVEEEVLSGVFNTLINIPSNNSINLEVILQGCDGKSICYPPQTFKFNINSMSNKTFFNDIKNFYQGNINFKDWSIIKKIILFFIAGILISLTPCLYPLFPIALSSIIGNTDKSTKQILGLTLCYIHGFAFIYIIIGIIAALSGKLLLTLIQTPIVILTGCFILLILSFAMLDIININIPVSLQSYIQSKSSKIIGGKYLTVFTIGILSSLILGACVTPPLIVAIGFIASSSSILLGIFGLYALSLGICTPIFILALMGNKILPKSGIWMVRIKYFIGILILITSIYLAYPFLNLGNNYLNIGIISLICALIYLIIKSFTNNLIIPILLLTVGISLTYYGFNHGSIQTKKIDNNNFMIVNKKIDLDNLIKQSNKPIILDVYASWCAICNEMELKTFNDPKLQNVLERYNKIKFDITLNSSEHSEFLTKFNLYGPPAILIFNKNKELKYKFLGFTSSAELIKILNNF